MGVVIDNVDKIIKNASDIAREVLQGNWGNGAERKARLIAAGYDPNEVQAAVNKMMRGEEVTETLEVTPKTYASGPEEVLDVQTLVADETVPTETATETVPTETATETVPTETATETVPTETATETVPTETVTQPDSDIDLSIYSGDLRTKSYATDDAKATAGQITTNNRTYTIVPDSEYTKAPGTISESDYKLLIAQVAGESGNSADDILGVTSTILNRLETGGYYGDSVTSVLEIGYFPWGRTYKGYIEGGDQYNTADGQAKLELVKQVVGDALAGTRNIDSNVYFYAGDGKHNYFSDVN